MSEDFYTVMSYGYTFRVDDAGEEINIDVYDIDNILLTEEDLLQMLTVLRSQ